MHTKILLEIRANIEGGKNSRTNKNLDTCKRTLVRGLLNWSLVMYQSNGKFNIPRANPGDFMPLLFLGVGNIIPTLTWVGDLNSKLDIVLRFLEGGMRSEMASFKGFKRKYCCFVTTWIKSKLLQRHFPVFSSCLQSLHFNKFLGRRHF